MDTIASLITDRCRAPAPDARMELIMCTILVVARTTRMVHMAQDGACARMRGVNVIRKSCWSPCGGWRATAQINQLKSCRTDCWRRATGRSAVILIRDGPAAGAVVAAEAANAATATLIVHRGAWPLVAEEAAVAD